MNEFDTDKLKYAIIYKSFGFSYIEIQIESYYENTDMYEIKDKNTGQNFIVKSSRLFCRKIDAIKRCNTLNDMRHKGINIPKII